jgi:hypothetical protein
MNIDVIVKAAIQNGFTVVVDDNYNFCESLTNGLYESHDSYGRNHKYYDTPERCVYSCLKIIKDNDYEYEILT